MNPLLEQEYLNKIKECKEKILSAYIKKVLFTVHALNQMNLSERMISKDEVYEIIENGEVIGEYKNNTQGYSCLISGKTIEERFLRIRKNNLHDK